MTCFLKHRQASSQFFYRFALLAALNFRLAQLSAKTATVARF
jgi:hypothetical protein